METSVEAAYDCWAQGRRGKVSKLGLVVRKPWLGGWKGHMSNPYPCGAHNA